MTGKLHVIIMKWQTNYPAADPPDPAPAGLLNRFGIHAG